MWVIMMNILKDLSKENVISLLLICNICFSLIRIILKINVGYASLCFQSTRQRCIKINR